MLPMPRHLLKIDPDNVVREIEDDPLSQFLWSLRPRLGKPLHDINALSATSTSHKDKPVSECSAQ